MVGIKCAAGSQNVGSIHVAGADVVPLLEGHADTRERFSWNPFTYSDVRSFHGGGKISTCEILFKGGPKLEAQLQAYVRRKGWSSWMTVQTSETGSYDEQHILAFLDKHLETGPPDRPWRIFCVTISGHTKQMPFVDLRGNASTLLWSTVVEPRPSRRQTTLIRTSTSDGSTASLRA